MKSLSQIFSFSILKSFTVIVFVTFHVFAPFLQVLGQTDDFSDGNFTHNPPWTGTEANFVVSSGALTLNATGGGSSYLVTESSTLVNTTWEFTVNLRFNPSSTNYARIYLGADNADLSSSLNGYFVMIGNTADEVSLYRQTGLTRTKIIDGRDGVLNLPEVIVRVKVTRDGTGAWQLFADVGVTGVYTAEGTAEDATHSTIAYFGMECVYTATRSTAFSFDDLTVESIPVEDHEPPAVDHVEAISATMLRVTFSEPLDPVTALKPDHYNVNNGVGICTKASIETDNRTVLLTFTTAFPEGQHCMLTMHGITDLAGNEIASTAHPFLYFTPVAGGYKDIVITEFLADPAPRVELPEAEFIEVFNRSAHIFDLSAWTIRDASTAAQLPEVLLFPGEYLIITSTAAAPLFNEYGKVVGVPAFPSLNNAGDAIMLESETAVLIDSVRYTNAWYRSASKQEGGWTLELIDPHNPCAEAENWVASEHVNGGTPGQQNSVYAEKPDLTGPVLREVYPRSPDTLKLVFNEKLENALPGVTSFIFTPALSIDEVRLQQPSRREIELVISSPLQHGILYQLQVTGLYDCAGNKINEAPRFEFALPEPASIHDVVINEVLFNPKPGGVDFVEIVNTSQKYIDLKNWSIGRVEDDVVQDQKLITTEHLLLRPSSYLVCTPQPAILKGEYLQGIEANFHLASLPSLNDDEGSVAIVNPDGTLIDAFVYADNMHSVFLEDTEGVSLERISLSTQTQDAENWKSASSQAGYATPGYVNSNARAEMMLDEMIRIEPEVFAPDAGAATFTQIHYRFDSGGFIANVNVYDAQGRLIKRIAENALLGTQGFLRWDGDRDDGYKARIGYYMIWFEVFNSDGVVKTLRKRVAIAGRF